MTLADVVGSFTETLAVTVRGGKVTYRGVNKTTLQSFWFGNILHRTGIDSYIGTIKDPDPGSGPLGTVTQTIYFQVPKQY